MPRRAALLIALPLAAAAAAAARGGGANVTGFVTRNGSTLLLGGAPWRFAGMNMYWLGLDENCSPGGAGRATAAAARAAARAGQSCVDYPTKYRQEDALATAAGLGANVVRAHSLGVSTGDPKSLYYQHTVNPAAWESIDHAIYLAGQHGIRLVVPLTDNYDYYHGGLRDFTNFRGKKCEKGGAQCPTSKYDDCYAFFADEQIIGDFKGYIKILLTHVNNYTGLALKDDPTILAWETGNELTLKGEPFVSWTEGIASYIKRDVGARQLVVDGRDPLRCGSDAAALANPSVDMYTDHFYDSWWSDTTTVAADAPQAAAKGKAFFVGEYGPEGGQWDASVGSWLTSLEQDARVAGDMWWSFFPHGDNYGFVPHGTINTIHFPGETDDMFAAIQKLRTHAYAVRGLPEPAYSAPPVAPQITSAKKALFKKVKVAWRGAALAVTYELQHLPSTGGNWTTVASDIWDVDAPYSVTVSGGSLRIRGVSADNFTGPWSGEYAL